MGKNRDKNRDKNRFAGQHNPHRPDGPATPAAVQGSSASQSTLSAALQKAKTAVASIAIGSPGDGAVPVMPEATPTQSEDMQDLDGERRSALEGLLAEIADVAKRLRDMDVDFRKRTEDLARKEEAFAKRSDENRRRSDELAKTEEGHKSRETDLKKAETAQADRERDLVTRELDARSGFAAQNAAALKDLKEEIASLESKRTEIRQEIHQTEEKARENETATQLSLQQREAEIAARDRALKLGEHRLEDEWKELESQKEQIRRDAIRAAEFEIGQLKDAGKRVEEKLQGVYDRLAEKVRLIEEYRELSDALQGRPPQEVVDEANAQKRRITELENLLARGQEGNLSAENETLRRIRDELKANLDEVNADLGATKGELHRLRLGVTDKENLEREKRSLEKANQILGARLNDLGKTVDDLTRTQQADKPFPQLSWMDGASPDDWIKYRGASELMLTEQAVPNLKTFATELRHRIAQAEDEDVLYFSLDDVRLLVAGLAMSQLHIFQGISGTGKTSLAKAFAKAVGGRCTDIAVQAGWRDRDDILGHYNAFEKRFYERDCLQGLYTAQIRCYRDRCNVILLDEMNLSRPEQYFAEFLSALAKNDINERLISLSEGQLPNAPGLLIEGRKIQVPENVWFMGTANHDETTNEFAPKTYDRAHVMTLPRHDIKNKFEVQETDRVAYSFSSLTDRFEEAIKKNADAVRDMLEELTTGPLTNVLQHFDVGWGNRFERQALRFMPVFMASGGHMEDALDHLLATRMLRRGRVTRRYDVKVKDLDDVEKALEATWKNWKRAPDRCLALLRDDKQEKEREQSA